MSWLDVHTEEQACLCATSQVKTGPTRKTEEWQTGRMEESCKYDINTEEYWVDWKDGRILWIQLYDAALKFVLSGVTDIFQ